MPDKRNPVKAIFLAALEKTTPAERAAFVEKACADDDTLRQQVTSLLEGHDRPDPLLDQPAIQHVDEKDLAPKLDFLEPSERSDSLGRLGHYEVLEVVAHGGTAVVLRAFDEQLHRVVAIKVLAFTLNISGAARQRFIREARATAAVTHDNVISIYAVEDGPGVSYLVMQFISGRTLQGKLDETGPLPLPEILRIGLQVAEGLAAAHRQGLIHRDIKPANILLENGVERVKITDFGLARAADDASLTQTGLIAGTPAYMSPEQGKGEHVDHRTDLFSLGSVLYAMCAGHPPFRAGRSLAVLKRVCEDTPRSLREINPQLPSWLEDVIMKLLAKDPARRFQSADVVAGELRQRLAQLQSDGSFNQATPWVMSHVAPADDSAQSPRFQKQRVWTRLLFLGVLSAGWFLAKDWWKDGSQTDPDARPKSTTAPPKTSQGLIPVTSKLPQRPPKPILIEPSRTLTRHTSGVRVLAYSPNGEVMASGGLDHNIYLWNTKTWEVNQLLEGHSHHVVGLAFSPDGVHLASVTSEPDIGLIRIWEVESGKPVGTFGYAQFGMWDVAYSPDGRTLACAGWDGALHLFEAETGDEKLRIPDVTTRFVRQISFSPDGKQIATGGNGGPTRLWNVQTGDEIELPATLPDNLCPKFLADGDRLACWDYSQGQVAICKLPSAQIERTWKVHSPTIEGLAVSPDGRFVASIGGGGVARIWSTSNYREVATLEGHEGAALAVAFSPDGKQLVTGGEEDLSICLWDLPEICHIKANATSPVRVRRDQP